MIKDQEFLKSKASYCLDLAKKLGATDASVTVGNSISESVSFRNRVLDESNRSDSLAISIATYIGKKRSSISSSNLLDENLKTLISKCFETSPDCVRKTETNPAFQRTILQSGMQVTCESQSIFLMRVMRVMMNFD